MLPLWIVDLREKSDRRDHFKNLVGQLDHVLISSASPSRESPKENREDVEEELSIDCEAQGGSETKTFNSNSSAQSEMTGTVKEAIEAEYREQAKRDSIILGNYWQYSSFAEVFENIWKEEMEEVAKRTASDEEKGSFKKESLEEEVAIKLDADTALSSRILYRFQCQLVKEGQKFIRSIRESNVSPHLKVNVVVLGDITEDFSRLVFPSVAALIQKEKGRLLASHIHQGMEIIGMLYIPSDINAKPVAERKKMRRTLTEIDIQHKVGSIRGYDHVMPYQDVQNRIEPSYGALNDKQVAEYLFQCIVNLYLATDKSHPVLSGTASADIFYFSMGACSLFFDTEREDKKARHKLAVDFMSNLKSDGDGEKVNEDLHILNDEDFSPESFFTQDALNKINVSDISEDAPSPHPIKNFFAKHLKRLYYNQHLRYYTKDLHNRIVETIDKDTKKALDSIAAESRRRSNDVSKHILDAIRDTLSKLSANDGGIPKIIELLKKMKEKISQRKSEVQGIMERVFWRRIIYSENGNIPRYLEDTFVEYHDVYRKDIRLKTGAQGQLEMKKEAINNLNGLLSKEPTILARICRSILLGIMLALGVVPVLNLISPGLLNIGRVARYAEWWSFGIFFVPFVFQFVSWWLYERKKKRAVRNLQALYLHDAYARVANRIESEIIGFYNKLIALGDQYEKRSEKIMQELEEGFNKDVEHKYLVPETTFNQPLIGGKFGLFDMLPLREAEDNWVNINFIRYRLNEIGKREFFLFINNNYNLISNLYKGVRVCENLLRRVNPEGKEVLISKDQQEMEINEEWIKLRENFHSELNEIVKLAIQPRENGTVGEKLTSYFASQTGSGDLLKPMIEYTAANGELVSSADKEFLDVKLNVASVKDHIIPYVSVHYPKMQLNRFHTLYKKYLFITRWRSFDHLSFNRILPMEDFDDEVRDGLVTNETAVETDYRSSLLLWALCVDDSSPDWYKLFPSKIPLLNNKEKFADGISEAWREKEEYREYLNQED